MAKQEFGPLRSKASRKPWPECPDIALYHCTRCRAVYQRLGGAPAEQPPLCCAAPMPRLESLPPEALEPAIRLDYAIVGGFNNNAVQVFWEGSQPEDRPEWILLSTFTGSALKYVSAKKLPPVVFSLADEDAYVYCDREACERCVFRCKRGFILYLYFKGTGLVEMPLDRMAAYFGSTPR